MQSFAVSVFCGLAFLGAAGAASAQEEPQDIPQPCRIHEAGEWQGLGIGSVTSCLKGIDRWVPEYNAQGFKFGYWSRLMLAADQNYFYHSDDGGKSWIPIGLKNQEDVRKMTERAPDLPGPGGATPTAPGAKAMTVAYAPVDRRPCSVFEGSAWANRIEMNLEQCAAELSRSSQPLDQNGYRYGYWNGLFLAADKEQVFRSGDGDDWQPVQPSN